MVAGGNPLHCVWRNELGGLTFELPTVSQFLKWAPAGSGPPLVEEATRLHWARRYTPVPEVIDAGTAVDGSTWLLTARLGGTSAVDERWKAVPRIAVRASRCTRARCIAGQPEHCATSTPSTEARPV